MKLFAIYNLRDRDKLIEFIKDSRLPFKCLHQDMYQGRSVDANAYLWGVVYPMIEEETGQSAYELHEEYKKLFNLRYDCVPKFDKDGNISLVQTFGLKVVGSSELSTVEFEQFCLKVRIHALEFLNISIPLPSECINKELKFEY